MGFSFFPHSSLAYVYTNILYIFINIKNTTTVTFTSHQSVYTRSQCVLRFLCGSLYTRVTTVCVGQMLAGPTRMEIACGFAWIVYWLTWVETTKMNAANRALVVRVWTAVIPYAESAFSLSLSTRVRIIHKRRYLRVYEYRRR